MCQPEFPNQVCSRVALARVRLRYGTQFAKIERGLKPRDYILGLSLDSIMQEASTILMILTNFVEFSRLSADFRDLHNAAVKKTRLPRFS